VKEGRSRYWLLAALGATVMLEWTMCASPPRLPPPAPPPPPPVKPPPPCPPEMAEVTTADGAFCVDRYEGALLEELAGGARRPWPGNRAIDDNQDELIAVSSQGQKPQGYISGSQAALACERAGKRLCTASEWKTACRGPEQTRYPYGATRRAGVCNDRFDKPTGHPVTRLFRQTKARGDKASKMWTPKFMNDPRLHELSDTVSPTGAFAECTNGYGVFDMVGNLHEWVADPKGTFMGGFFMDTRLNGEGCDYRTTAHDFGYHDYSTGFRCCSDTHAPTPGRANSGLR
jgi:sulfatase modifying factor 1